MTIHLSPLDVLTAAVNRIFRPFPLKPDHPARECEYCDSLWTVELNNPENLTVIRVCADCADKVACEHCGERIPTVRMDDGARLCVFCHKDLTGPQVTNVLPTGGLCACGTEDVFGCTCGSEVRS